MSEGRDRLPPYPIAPRHRPIHTRIRECHTRVAPIEVCRALLQPQSGPPHCGRRPPPHDGGVDIAAAALTESRWYEHSTVDTRPDSVPDIARSNPAAAVGVAMVQGALTGRRTPSGYCSSGEQKLLSPGGLRSR